MNILRPYKSDIRQIDSLVKLGCSHSDIASILGITPAQLQKWEVKSRPIAELLKPKARPEYTLNHPDYAPMVEEAFACAGKRYYRFKEEYRQSSGRYKYHYSTLREVELKLSLSDLQKYVDAFELVLNGGAKKKNISITNLYELVSNLKSRIKLAFDVDTVKKLAAVVYFDDTEDLTTFNEKYGQKKIQLWEANNLQDFFLTRLIAELLGVNSSSIIYFQEHLKEMDGIKQELNFNLQKLLEENS